MIKIYAPLGSPLISSSAGRCFLLLEEIGVEYKPIFISFKDGENKSEEYLRLNPNGKIPTLIDEEENFILWESMAINNYLAEKYKPELLGKNIKDKANINRWNYWTLSEYQVPIVQLMIHTRFLPEDKRDTKTIEASLEKISKLNKILDDYLEGKQYLNGEKLSLADLNIAPVASACFMFKIDLSNLNNFTRWLNNICSRESFKKLMG